MVSAMAKPVDTYESSPEQEEAFYLASSTSQGRPATQKHSKEELLKTHFENLKLLQVSKTAIKKIVLPNAYSPSLSSLDTLQKMSLNELKIENHHRGSFLTAKTISPPYQTTEIVTLIEDENGDVAKLVLGFQDDHTSSSGVGGLPMSSTVAVKEPYCKFNGEGDYVIRVDHPSDIAVLRGDDPAVLLIMQFVAEGKQVSPLQWKSAGDRSYLEKKYTSAIECYTQAIDTSPSVDRDFIQDVHKKRAFANLTARLYTAAKNDALASFSENVPDEKAYYCAGKAAYGLGAYGESKGFFEAALKLSPGDSRYQKELKRAIARIREEEDGVYDFESMVASVTENNVHLDHADWTKNTLVQSAGTHGRGLFAARDLEPGDLVLCEKAFCLPNRYSGEKGSDLIMFNLNTTSRTQRPAQTALFLQLVQKIYNSQHLANSFFDLDGGGYLRSGKEGELVDGVPIVDTFLVEAIRLTNCFSCPRLSLDLLKTHLGDSEMQLSTGLWRKAAYLNHSCVPNCTRAFIGDMMLIHATCSIPAGTELTHQYTTPDEDLTLRQKTFKTNWAFECDCRLCATEKQSPESMQQQRRELVTKIRTEVLKAPLSTRIPTATIKHIERLTKKLEELHEPSIYASLPRLLLVHTTIWLAEAWRSHHNPVKTIKYAFEVLRNFGFVDIDVGKLELDFGRGIVNSESFNAIRYAAQAYAAVGKMEMQKLCEQEARRMFVVLTGSEVGVEEVFAKEVGIGRVE